MLKKSTWVVGLLAALAMMFIGCVDAPEEEGGGEIVEVVSLAKIIADVPDGVITDWGKIFDGTPFMKAGSPKVEVITENKVKKLKISEFGATWGVGLDVRHEASDSGNSGVDFRKGDELLVKGSATPAANAFFVNVKIGAERSLGNWKATTDEFEQKLTITADDINAIKTSDPKGARLNFKDGDRQGTFILEEVSVTGNRSAANDPFGDDFEYSGIAQQENWVTGLTITPKKGKTTGAITTYYEGVSPTVYVKSKVVPQAIGEYAVTFDVAASKGWNAVTGLEMPGSMLVLDVIPAGPKTIELAGDAWTGFAFEGTGATYVSGPGKKFVFLYNAITNPVPVTETPVAIQGFTASATPRIVYQFTDTKCGAGWQGYKEVVLTYDLVKTSLTGTDGNTTNVIVRYNTGASYSNSGDLGYPDLKEGSGQTYTIKMADVLATSADGFSFTKNHAGTGILIKITKIDFITY